MTVSDNNLVWLDLEMTGLDTFNDDILEIATVITDSHLNILAEGPVFAIHQSNEKLDAMDKWNQRQHKKSGLIDRVQQSNVKISEAEEMTLEFIKNFVPHKKSPLCGNSICQDRRFLARLMPTLEDYFHYRNLDVSTVKELALRWSPKVQKFKKKQQHLALQDIKDSIEELVFYREKFFHL
ncbi:MAG TPA: oligoribonuclease [Gammaproteobacteria bacterium]|nr:oligoribonuclease [Gammaproteobacteria bacterium]